MKQRLYHVTQANNLSQIMVFGLEPRNTQEHNHPNVSAHKDTQAVFCWSDLRQAVIWLNRRVRLDGVREALTIIEIDAEGLEWMPDPALSDHFASACMVRQHIHPTKIRDLTWDRP